MSYQYLLHGPLLRITCSDSEQEHVDEKRLRSIQNHPDGRERTYVQQFKDSPVSKDWRQKLGQELAIKFLLKPANVDYILAKFPKSYMLFCQVKGDNHEIDRSDAYLFSDDHKFRSPAEFVPHAAWLIAGMPPGRCKCKYCNHGKGEKFQTKLKEELETGVLEAKNNELKKQFQASRNGERYTPRDRPLEEVYLKAVPGPGAV